MGLSHGTQLGSYEVLDPLGAGGMGEVYRARDVKLKREVAIKVLPEQFSRDNERLARFRREAQVLAALNHPNIAAVYGMEESAETMALVMEIVEGNDLAGPLSIDVTLDYARQIAEALEAAHEKGIVHRDLKPSNIKVTFSGVVKVLDFGLATIVQAADADRGVDIQNSPTITRSLDTQAGAILGTAAYMSPEQASGKAVDKRSDIWSFGAVLFEMLTGERLFSGGETVSHVLADVLRSPIDLSKLPASTPSQVRDLLERCLERDVKNRLRDIGEARVVLERARRAPPTVMDVREAKPMSSRVWIAAAIGSLVVAAITGLGWWRAARPVDQPFLRFTDNVGADVPLSNSAGPSIAISRDGLRVAFVARESDGRTRLSVRTLSNPKEAVLSGTEGIAPMAPFFSPDGSWIGFFSGSKLKKISIEGGAAVTVSDIGSTGPPRGGYWGEDDHILFATQLSPVMRVPASGGTPTAATELTDGEVTNRYAQLLPGGDAFLFTASRDNNIWEDATIYVQSIKTKTRKPLLRGGYFGRYVPSGKGSGHLVYVHEGVVFAAPMDLAKLHLTGPGVPVLEDVAGLTQSGFAQLDFSLNGTAIYIPGSSSRATAKLALIDMAGKIQELPALPALYMSARPSPDGSRLLLRVTDSTGTNLSVYELVSNRMTRLTFIKGVIPNNGVWAPDGKHIVFPIATNELAGPGLYWIRADGASEPHRLTDRFTIPSSFSPDGKRIVYFAGLGTGVPENGIWTLPLDLDDPERPRPGNPELFLKSPTTVQNPVVSPDGRWIAYISSETQPPQVFIRPFLLNSPGTGGKWQVSNDAASHVFWSRSGNELFYLTSGGARVVPYTTTGDTLDASPPRAIPWPGRQMRPATTPELMPDGKRFIIVTTPGLEEIPRETHLAFLLNFSDELERRSRER